MNYKTLADAIAARFANVVATNGAATETLSATAELPDTITKSALLVYPPVGTLEMVLGPRYFDTLDYPIRLLRDPLSVPQRTNWLHAWATALRPLARDIPGSTLGLSFAGAIEQAGGVALRVELDGEEYAASPFDVVEIIYRVKFLENVV